MLHSRRDPGHAPQNHRPASPRGARGASPASPFKALATAAASLALFAGHAPAADASDCAAADTLPTPANTELVEHSTLCRVNDERRARGLRPLRHSGTLARAALGHSEDMVAKHYFAHDSRDGGDFTDRIRLTGFLPGYGSWFIAENLAWGTGHLSSPRAIVRAWMNSPPHRRHLLSRRYRVVGIGVVHGSPPYESWGATYTMDLGHRTRR